MQDMTERRHAELQLAEAQTVTHIGSWEWDIVADRLAWSDEHYRIFGLEPQAHPITLVTVLEYVHPADRAAVERYAVDVRQGFHRSGIEYRIRRADGSERVLEAWGRTEVSRTGRPMRMFGTVQDITDRRRADETLGRSQQEFRDIFEYASVGIFRSSRDGRVLLANTAFARLLGYDSPEALGPLDLARDVYVDPAERETLIQRYDSTGGGWTIEIQWKKQDGTPFWVLLSAHAVKDVTGRSQYFESFVQDVTAQRQSRQELARSRRLLRQLAARLEEVREQDRTIIAREIHDELGQALTALRMDLSWMVGHLPAKPAGLAEKAQAMVGVVDQTIDAVRRIATQLRPPILDDLGLVAAIEWQAGETAARTGIRCELDLPPAVQVDDAHATIVFRIFQEALTNVVRHAGAASVRVTLRTTPEELALEVQDDGRGISAAQLSDQRALGLLGMRERAQTAGGLLEVFAGPTQGTTVALRLPIGGPPAAQDVR